MKQDWQSLTQMVNGQPIVVTRIEVESLEVAIEGRFELPPLAQLSIEDQIFIATFVGAHGSIKEMERIHGISYPTVKARLKKISAKLAQLGLLTEESVETRTSVLDQLADRQISVDDAIKELNRCSH